MTKPTPLEKVLVIASAFLLLTGCGGGPSKSESWVSSVKSEASSRASSAKPAVTTAAKPPPGSVLPDGVQIRTEQGAGGEAVIAEFDIGDAIFMSLTKIGARGKTKEILEYVKNKYPQASTVEVQGRFPTKDAYGNSQKSVVLDVLYTRDTIDKINFAGIDNDKIWAVRDSGTIHPELQ